MTGKSYYGATASSTDPGATLTTQVTPCNQDEIHTVHYSPAERGHIESVQLLLEHGADPAIRDNNGLTALDWANNTGQKAVADHLLQKRPIE